MKQDSIQPTVEDVVVAVVPRQSEDHADLWDIYLINTGEQDMENIVVTSQGYGMLDGKDKTTTILRHFHQRLEAGASIKIEPIEQQLFAINNEYQVSFSHGEAARDRKFVFRSGEISRDLLGTVPVMGVSGVFKY